jgi:adenosylcobinamide-GDP ribazoletransferase
MPVRRQISLFFIATQFLTRVPVPTPQEFQLTSLAYSARYFPLVGALVGTANVAVWWLCRHWFPSNISIGLMLAASLLITGALHEDGFADACDGFGAGRAPEQILMIMKDSRIGAYGAIGIVMLLGLKWLTLLAVPESLFPVLVISAHMVSRWCATGLIWALHYVRLENDGKAKPFADSLTGGNWLLSGLIGAAPIVAFALARAGATLTLLGTACAAATLAALATAGLAAIYCRIRIGGYTGDCLGAVQQLSELAFLLIAIAVLVPAPAFG